MKKNKLVSFVHSLVLVPIMSASLITPNINNREITQSASVPKFNIETSASSILAFAQPSAEEVAQTKARKIKANAIDNYFKERDMPLFGTGMKMVLEAEKNDLDWRLLPAIAVRESTGGKHDCNNVRNNAFGWGSCKIGFMSDEEAIEVVAWNLGGNNPKTERHYDNKTTRQILRAYNPPSIVPNYVPQVLSIMAKIGSENLGEDTNA